MVGSPSEVLMVPRLCTTAITHVVTNMFGLRCIRQKPQNFPKSVRTIMRPCHLGSFFFVSRTPLSYHRWRNRLDTNREAIRSLMYASDPTTLLPSQHFPNFSIILDKFTGKLSNEYSATWYEELGLNLWGREIELERYSDVDGASLEHRRAISRYAFIMNGGCIFGKARTRHSLNHRSRICGHDSCIKGGNLASKFHRWGLYSVHQSHRTLLRQSICRCHGHWR